MATHAGAGKRRIALLILQLLEAEGADAAVLRDVAAAERAEGRTAMFVAVDGVAAGVLSVAERVKETTPAAIRALHDEGLRIVILTGDAETTTRAVARDLGIDEMIAEVLPEDKHDVIRRLRADGRTVAMAGDGVSRESIASVHTNFRLERRRGWSQFDDGARTIVQAPSRLASVYGCETRRRRRGQDDHR